MSSRSIAEVETEVSSKSCSMQLTNDQAQHNMYTYLLISSVLTSNNIFVTNSGLLTICLVAPLKSGSLPSTTGKMKHSLVAQMMGYLKVFVDSTYVYESRTL